MDRLNHSLYLYSCTSPHIHGTDHVTWTMIYARRLPTVALTSALSNAASLNFVGLPLVWTHLFLSTRIQIQFKCESAQIMFAAMTFSVVLRFSAKRRVVERKHTNKEQGALLSKIFFFTFPFQFF